MILQVKANPKAWFIFTMLPSIPIFSIILAMGSCNVKVKVVKRHQL